MKLLIYAFGIIFLLSACDNKTNKSYLFQQVNSKKSGVFFENKLTDTPKLNILTYLYYYNGAGVAAGDFNNDGLIDLYFIGNQVANKFYLNKGNFKFIDVTETAHLNGQKGWSSGVTVADVNGDGLLDIYVCQVADKKWFKGKNQLYINLGTNKDGIPVFKDEAEQYGLAISSYSNQATFFDYDLDGDLDCFLMKNQSVHPSATFGRFKRHVKNAPAGDKLFRNDNGHFTEVTFEAGIFSSLTGYGLGLAISDLNHDGWPDIYVGNDFFENDYFYLNQKNGTFKEQISKDFSKLGHTTHFSMGNDIADFNNDGFPDIVSVDMLPENRLTYNQSGTEYEYAHYLRFLKNGYAPQYMHNTLHLNLQNNNFSEIGFYSGIAATEWSWAPLLADFDNDGNKDLFISTGIYGATNNMDFINFISSSKNQHIINKGMSKNDMNLIDKIPKVSAPNYMFKNEGNYHFKKMNGFWLDSKNTFSNGALYADLDNDGDLDLVINNLNEPSTIYQNQSQKKNFLKIKFKGKSKNTYGIGAKVTCYYKHKKQFAENYTTRGYLSAIAPQIHFGLDTIKKLDSLKVVWPNHKTQLLKKIKTNQTITLIEYQAKTIKNAKSNKSANNYLVNVPSKIKYKNFDYPSYAFKRNPLIPFMQSNLGPHISIADVNHDGLDDVFIGGSKLQKSHLFIQTKTGDFIENFQEAFAKDFKKEDADHIFIDTDNDGDKDLIIVSGGDEFKSGENLKPRLYLNENGIFSKKEDAFSNIYCNASVVKAADFNKDGFIDLFIGTNSKPQNYGEIAPNYILKNNGKNQFINVTNTVCKDLLNVGNIRDASWVDWNKDGYKDLILVGHWMPITIFINHQGNQFTKQVKNGLKNSNGWYNCIKVADFDKDGDFDFVVGNWGENTFLIPSLKEPITLYLGTFAGNNKKQPIITYYYKNQETLLPTITALFEVFPNLKFKSFDAIANKKINEIFTKKNLNKAKQLKAYNLSSCYFENLGNHTFKQHKLPIQAQWSDIETMLIDDFNSDGFDDILTAGNLHEINTQFGRLDASHGVLLLNDRHGNFKTYLNLNKSFNIKGAARSIKKIILNDNSYYFIGVNNDSLQMIKKTNFIN
ncbi:MAG: VCBS repeat-containing protein [Lutibacter sp.]